MKAKKQSKAMLSDLFTQVFEDNLDQGAAALGYYLTLSIFPAMIVLLSVTAYIPVDNLEAEIMGVVERFFPSQPADLIRKVVEEVAGKKRGGLLSVGVVAAIWTSSRGVAAIIQQMNIAYNTKETRSFLKVNALAILMTFFFGFIVFLTFTSMATQNWLEHYLVAQIGFEEFIVWIFNLIKWVTIFAIITTGFSVIFCYGPDTKIKYRWLSFGTAFATFGMALSTYLFSLYVNNFPDYSATYGSIGAVILLMLWFYITGWVLLLGAEINALLGGHISHSKIKKLRSES